jgi:hypothetical protein
MRPLAFLPFIVLILTSCVRPASSPPTATPPNAPTATLAPYNAPFPLNVGATWIYEYTSYFEETSVTWRVTEVITQAGPGENGVYIAEMQRTSRLLAGQLNDRLIFNLPDGKYKYVFDGNHLYLQPASLPLLDLQNSTPYLSFPIAGMACSEADILCRKVLSGPEAYTSLAGQFANCYQLVTPSNSGTEIQVFCENMGFVSGKYDHLGSPFGYRLELIGYSVPEK